MRPTPDFCCATACKAEFDEETLRESGVFSWKAENSRQPSAVGLSKT